MPLRAIGPPAMVIDELADASGHTIGFTPQTMMGGIGQADAAMHVADHDAHRHCLQHRVQSITFGPRQGGRFQSLIFAVAQCLFHLLLPGDVLEQQRYLG